MKLRQKVILSFALVMFIALVFCLFVFFYKSDKVPAYENASTIWVPNPELTPGEVSTTNSSIICAEDYQKKISNMYLNVSNETVQKVIKKYPDKNGAIVTLIPLELGGALNERNLWVEPLQGEEQFFWKYHTTEYLRTEVCAGRLSLEEAQSIIKNQWYEIYLGIMKNGKK